MNLRRLLAHRSGTCLNWQCSFRKESWRLCVQSRNWIGVVPGPFFYLWIGTCVFILCIRYWFYVVYI